ncbi:MAG: hypothetical protein IKW76_08865 [Clostridia bacterium]|nr:hypothetical protein [Clostridia bacterium]
MTANKTNSPEQIQGTFDNPIGSYDTANPFRIDKNVDKLGYLIELQLKQRKPYFSLPLTAQNIYFAQLGRIFCTYQTKALYHVI